MAAVEKSKIQVGAKRVAKADPATVYEIAAYSPGYPEWGTIGSFEEVRPGATERYGSGSERIYRTGPFTIREEVVDANKPCRVSYSLLSGFPLRDYLGEIDIAPEGDGTLIHWHSSFNPPMGFGWFWKLFMQNVISTMTDALVKEAERVAGEKKAA